MKIQLLLASLFLLYACQSTVSNQEKDSTANALSATSVVFETSRCYGPCPVYILQVNANGLAQLEAKSDVKTAKGEVLQGSYTAQIESGAWSKFEKRLLSSDFLASKEQYGQIGMDNAHYKTDVTYSDGSKKKVLNFKRGTVPQVDEIYPVMEKWVAELNWKRN